MRDVLPKVEIVGLLAAIVFAVLWVLRPTGSYEPYLALTMLLATSGVEHVRRYLKDATGSWNAFDQAVRKVISEIKREGFKPDIVVLFGRGGAVFGSVLAGNLGNLPIVAMDRKVWQDKGEVFSEIIQDNSLEVTRGKNILLVDGEVITGISLRQALDSLKAYSPQKIRSAAYHVCATTSLFPEYYGYRSSGPVDVPWRMMSEYRRRSKPWLDGN